MPPVARPPLGARGLLQQLEHLACDELAQLQQAAARQAAPGCGYAQASLAWDLGLDARDLPADAG